MEDVFITFVSRDKQIAHDLKSGLERYNLSTLPVQLGLGDSLAYRIKDSLREAKFGIIILSEEFFRKRWPQFELDEVGAIDQSFGGDVQVIPVWYKIEPPFIARFSEILAKKRGASIQNDSDLEYVLEEIVEVVKPSQLRQTNTPMQDQYQKSPSGKIGTSQNDLVRMRSILVEYFSTDELYEICLDLEVDFENLPGSGKSRKAMELIGYLRRRGQFEELVVAVQRRRPNIQW